MKKLDYKIREKEEVKSIFRNWLYSAVFLPSEILYETMSVKQHTLPIADISYDFKIKWTANIGHFQEAKYNKKCDRIRKINENRKTDNKERMPLESDSDFWIMQNNQHDVYKDTCNVRNQSVFSYDNLDIEKKVVSKHLTKNMDTFFNNFTNTESIKHLQSVPDNTDHNIAQNNVSKCRKTAIANIPFPGDKQENVTYGDLDILNYRITRKYYQVYVFYFDYKDKKYVYCCDMTATKFTGKRPRADYFDEMIIGSIGTASLLTYLLSGVLPINEWADIFGLQQSTFEIILLIIAIIGIGYVVISYFFELSKASLRRKELEQYEKNKADSAS